MLPSSNVITFECSSGGDGSGYEGSMGAACCCLRRSAIETIPDFETGALLMSVSVRVFSSTPWPGISNWDPGLYFEYFPVRNMLVFG